MARRLPRPTRRPQPPPPRRQRLPPRRPAPPHPPGPPPRPPISGIGWGMPLRDPLRPLEGLRLPRAPLRRPARGPGRSRVAWPVTSRFRPRTDRGGGRFLFRRRHSQFGFRRPAFETAGLGQFKQSANLATLHTIYGVCLPSADTEAALVGNMWSRADPPSAISSSGEPCSPPPSRARPLPTIGEPRCGWTVPIPRQRQSASWRRLPLRRRPTSRRCGWRSSDR